MSSYVLRHPGRETTLGGAELSISFPRRMNFRREMSETQILLALDYGGTKHTAAVVARGGRYWRAYRQVLSPPGADARCDIETMNTLARELLGGTRPGAIGVSFGGPVDAATGTVRLSHHVPGWENVPLQEILETEFDAPASVENDANVAALGEHRFGAGQEYEDLMYITVSTGVGGGWILNGQIWHGAEGMAGEIGHTVVDPNGPACTCGKQGCVERLASGLYIAQRAREWLERQPNRGKILRKLIADDLEAVSAKLVSGAAAQGDDLAWEALEVAGWALGVGIGNAANLVNPQRFILGGGVTKAGERYWEVVRRAARETAMPEVHFDVVPAALGDDAPLWGAVVLAEDCLPSPQLTSSTNP
jgi:glucokinase